MTVPTAASSVAEDIRPARRLLRLLEHDRRHQPDRARSGHKPSTSRAALPCSRVASR
jgi:hypothetical protein